MQSRGRIVVLNGAPRAGKSSIAAAMQRTVPGTWMNLGVDRYMRATPPHLLPGIGLRPGGERPDLEVQLPAMYAALYESIAAHSREGLDVVVDVGHHDWYAEPRGILVDAARRLTGLPAWLIGVRCPLDEIMARRGAEPGAPVPDPVRRWQDAVHDPGIYDLEVDTARATPDECATRIGALLHDGEPPTAFARLAARS